MPRARWTARLGLMALLCPAVLLAEPARPLTATEVVPVDPAVVEQAVNQLFAAWNTSALPGWLAQDFAQRARLLSTLNFDLPPTARLRVLGLGGAQTLEQYRTAEARISLVRVLVRGELSWEDPRLGPQRHEGYAEYVLRLRREVPR